MSNSVKITEYETPVVTDSETFYVPTTVYEKRGGIGVGVFANGFCGSTLFYKKLIEGVVDLANLEYVVSPSVSGMKIRGDKGSVFPNDSHRANVDLFEDVVRTHVGDDRIFYLGHSHGCSMSYNAKPSKAVLINPILPVDYGWESFVIRGFGAASRMPFNFGLPGRDERVATRETLVNFLGNISNNIKTIKDFSSEGMDGYYPNMKDTDALLLTSQATSEKYRGGDEFFNFDIWESELENRFRSLNRIRISEDTDDEIKGEFSHNLVVVRPEYFIPHIANFLAA